MISKKILIGALSGILFYVASAQPYVGGNSRLRRDAPKCEGDLVYYRGWDLRDCLPCDGGCSKDQPSCPPCMSGCGCPKGLVKSPTDHTKCIWPEDCPPTDSDELLIGKLISQGSSRSELVGAARQQGVGPSQIEEVKGKEVAESSRQHVEPQNELAIGTKIKEYQQNPLDAQVRMDIGGTGRMAPIVHVPRAHGKVLDNDVKTGKYVPNPIKVLGEIKARGGDIETVEGEVVAGDAGDVDVVSLKESETLSRSPCASCPSGTICCISSHTCASSCSDERARAPSACPPCQRGQNCNVDTNTCE